MNNSSKKSSNTTSTTDDDDGENRLGQYATLRPLHKSNQTRHTNNKTNNFFRNSFNELNLIDTYSALVQDGTTSPSTSSRDESVGSLSEVASTPYQMENVSPVPQIRVDECLSELDAYLEAIENSTNLDVDQITNNDSDTSQLIDNSSAISTKPHHHNFSTLPKNFSRIHHYCEDSWSSSTLSHPSSPSPNPAGDAELLGSTFHRGHPKRNTIVTFTRSPCNGGMSTGLEEQQQRQQPQPQQQQKLRKSRIKKTGTEPQRRQSWHRNSMRRARPITLPDQPEHHTLDRRNNNQHYNSTQIITPSSQQQTNRGSDPLPQMQTAPREPASPPPPNYHSSPTLNDSRLSNESSNIIFPLDVLEGLSQQQSSAINRPRQMGRRAEVVPRLVSITHENVSHGGGSNGSNSTQNVRLNHDRPTSAPARATGSTGVSPGAVAAAITVAIAQPQQRATQSSRRYDESEPSSAGSSRNASPVSIASSTASSSIVSAVGGSNERPRERLPSSSDSSSDDAATDLETVNEITKWPHQYGRALATICCCVGVFNLSRFAICSVHFGGNFILQFLILSLVFGIPMLWLQMCLGAKTRSGPLSMWGISPICKGIGISLLIGQGLIALYSTLSLSWILVFFRDSFTSDDSVYRWQEVLEFYRGYGNYSVGLSERVADYFNGVVLQRVQLGPAGRAGATGLGPVRFQLAFNLSIVWLFAFVILCRGLRSYGRCLIWMTIVPLCILLAVTIKMLTVIQVTTIQNLFPATDWPEFFSNSQSWYTAAQETFLTWILLGTSVISMCAKSNKTLAKNQKLLRRDAIFVALFAISALLIAAVFGNVCVQLLQERGHYYFPGSYDTLATDIFLYRRGALLPQSIPTKYLPRYQSVLGETIRQLGLNAKPYKDSGYQAVRLLTEVVPSAFAVADDEVSSIWCMLTYLAFLLFGIAQLCAMWKPIANLLGNSPSGIMLSCVTGLLLGMPLATESGINIIHFMDIILGGAWWVLLIWIAQIFAVFLIRGRPYSADLLVNDLHLSQTLSAFIAFSWNLLIPIIMIMLCILEYKTSHTKELFHKRGAAFWPLWTRQVGGLIQVSFLILVPATAAIQIYRYLTKGPPDILDRVQLLYRPGVSATSHTPRRIDPPISTIMANNLQLETHGPPSDDPPPKYTPPPSYTTATGARIAKMLRQSIRRSVRRIMGEPSRNRLNIPQTSGAQSSSGQTSLPPDYTSIFSTNPSGESDTGTVEMGPRILYNSHTQRNTSPRVTTSSVNERSRNLTSNDVAQLLRPARPKSHRTLSLGGCIGGGGSANRQERANGAEESHKWSVSLENLVTGFSSREKTNDTNHIRRQE